MAFEVGYRYRATLARGNIRCEFFLSLSLLAQHYLVHTGWVRRRARCDDRTLYLSTACNQLVLLLEDVYLNGGDKTGDMSRAHLFGAPRCGSIGSTKLVATTFFFFLNKAISTTKFIFFLYNDMLYGRRPLWKIYS